MRSNSRTKRGFTLVEILIVVIILGILAAIIIPQFTDASTSAKESTLKSNLQTLRSQVGLYKIQHDDGYPGDTDGDKVSDDAANFEADMIGVTDVDGTAVAAGTPASYGPYMPNIPDNPFTNDPENTPKFTLITSAAISDGVVDGDGSAHWAFVTDTGQVVAWDGDSGPAPDSIPHDDY